MNSNWYVPPKKEIQSVENQLQYSLVHGHYKQANIISRMIINQQWSPAVIYLDLIMMVVIVIVTEIHLIQRIKRIKKQYFLNRNKK